MTYHPKSDFMRVMIERGYLADCTDYQGLDEALTKGTVTAYIGYDATAKSLHVGHLLNIMMLRWLQKTGHRPITLMGGGTTKVGDPSFRSDERPLLGPDQINENISGMKRVFARYLDYDDPHKASDKSIEPAAMGDFLSVLQEGYKEARPKANVHEFTTYLVKSSAKRLAQRYDQLVTSRSNQRNVHRFSALLLAQELKSCLKQRPKNSALMLDNAEWLDGLNYLEFLRDIGRHFSVNRMLSYESVKSRLDREQSLSFLEFNYMILQAYDFLELNRRYDCVLQMGGSDQWGNIVNGIDLTRRVIDHEVYGLTSPLLTTSDGRKMGKSAGGAMWLDAEMLSPYEFWQFWRNTTDADTGRFLKLYTELPVEDCERLGALAGSEINEAKIILANEVTTLLHGAEAAEAAEATAREVFEKGGVGDDLPTVLLSRDNFAKMSPAHADPQDPNRPVTQSILAFQLFLEAGLVKSGKEAKRLFAEGGARINDVVETDITRTFAPEDFSNPIKLSAGKKRHALIKLID
jgi:tyrosyl-tRNA synthetase